MIFETLAPKVENEKQMSAPRRQSLNMTVPVTMPRREEEEEEEETKQEPTILGSDEPSPIICRRSTYDGSMPVKVTTSETTTTQEEALSSPSRHRRGNKKQRARSVDNIALGTVKYITGETGIRKLNPAWEEAQNAKFAQEVAANANNNKGHPMRASARASFALYPFVNRSTALPIMSFPSQEDLFDLLALADDDSDYSDSDKFGQEKDETKTTNAANTLQTTPAYDDARRDYESQWHFQALQEYEALEALNEYEDITRSTSFRQKDDHGYNEQMQKELEETLERYEVPAGMLSKLMGLQNYALAEILVDDSARMNELSDVEITLSIQQRPQLPKEKGYLTRWAEAKERIMQMMEFVAYIPTAPTFLVCFLNRSDEFELKRQAREAPQDFLERVERVLDNAFDKKPQQGDGSPALERIRESFHKHHRKHTDGVLRYFMSHGVPDGGEEECHKIVHLLMYRAQPERNPFTFLSCTDQDGDTEWMKGCEETAPYCSEFDDYIDESDEILRDQGKAFPYSYGLHLVGQLVAAFNPHDLDAMDESVPFTRQTLADLLGYQLSDAEYKYYFDSFLEAQQKQRSSMEPYQKDFIKTLPRLYDSFYQVCMASDIVEVRNFRRRLKADSPQISLTTRTTSDDPSTGTTEQAPESPQRRWPRFLRENSMPRLFRENSIQRLFGKGLNNSGAGQNPPSSPTKKKNKLPKRLST